MKRLNLSFFMELAISLRVLANTPKHEPETKARPEWRASLSETVRLLGVFKQDETLHLRTSKAHVAKFLEVAQPILRKSDSELINRDEWTVYWVANPLFTLLHAELDAQPVYGIQPKRIFDIDLLVEKATAMFSSAVREWLTEKERYNIEQAGKCIAFETPTAAGFHLLRATESVIQRYYGAVIGHPPAVKARNWGTYIKALRACDADERVLHALDQIKDLYRNPIIHPEEDIDLDAALSLLGIVESLVSAIHADMKRRQEVMPPTLRLAARSGTNLLPSIPGADDIPF